MKADENHSLRHHYFDVFYHDEAMFNHGLANGETIKRPWISQQKKNNEEKLGKGMAKPCQNHGSPYD